MNQQKPKRIPRACCLAALPANRKRFRFMAMIGMAARRGERWGMAAGPRRKDGRPRKFYDVRGDALARRRFIALFPDAAIWMLPYFGRPRDWKYDYAGTLARVERSAIRLH